jgi:uncharacterized CHY-type Zn-finger protein
MSAPTIDPMAEYLADLTAHRHAWSTSSLVMCAECVPEDTAQGWIVRVWSDAPPDAACEHIAAMLARSDNPDTWHLRHWYVALTDPTVVLCGDCAAGAALAEEVGPVWCCYCGAEVTTGGALAYHQESAGDASRTSFGWLCRACRDQNRHGKLPGLFTTDYGPGTGTRWWERH